jgi:UDP-glucose 4-epimerase
VNVLVTGAGLVGCNVARLLAERGHNAILVDRSPNKDYIASVAPQATVVATDVQELATLIETMQQHRVDTVVHTAFLIGASLMARPYAGVKANVDGSLALIEAAHLSGAKKFLFASTQGVYNYDAHPRLPTVAPIGENSPLVGPLVYYTASKIACEQLLPLFAAEYKLAYATLRFAQIYGRGHYLAGDFLGMVMHDALAAAVAGKPVEMDPGIVTYNDHVYAKDVALGVVLACEKPLKHRVYNIGSGRLTGPDDVVAAIDAAFPGAKARMLPKPVVGPFWVHEQYLDITRMREDLGYEPQYDLKTGIADFARELRAATPAATT